MSSAGRAPHCYAALRQTSTVHVEGERFPWTTGSVTATSKGRGPHKTVHYAQGFDNRNTTTPPGLGTIQLVTPVLTRWLQLSNNFETGGIGIPRIKFIGRDTQAVSIDIKPGSDPNSINPSLEGDLPVAILGSDSFDVADVDVATLAFGPSGASFDHSHGPHFEDLNGDGFDDGQEVLLMGTDPLDPVGPTPVPAPEPAARLVVLAGAALLGLLHNRQKGKRRR